ncbi:hypothetical protein PR202_ga06600 [Eleusine coracana subsp. coracana]|uniref:Uncharacterized protein n=1 Tax=Eleusine coracana subsp. coracana TaxID=191504 RepID=A0AAV5BWG8_ELECO|nr:hypothetical protein PR202_ga06600 [Eleusine coracana subsp. coracana]
MAERERQQTDEVGNMVTFLGGLACVKKLQIYLPTEYSQESRYAASPVPLAPEFWEKQINADCVLNHLSSFTFLMEPPFDGHPCGGLCRFMVMNGRVLKRMRIEYLRSQVKLEHATKLEAVRNELNLCPRASPDVLVELSPLRCYPSC